MASKSKIPKEDKGQVPNLFGEIFSMLTTLKEEEVLVDEFRLSGKLEVHGELQEFQFDFCFGEENKKKEKPKKKKKKKKKKSKKKKKRKNIPYL